ncbi:2-succinyl-5-enolpyruvyl-6-hydroxy-3-cyclohexene-1-carboxylic-acid synthase [Enterococcus rivorum]|uniref:2-succinyl-5-enolpyruvyl-6-hydroxy-3-cyclohexene-1-carboxylate synthase n=1 Tax=Enterococcus rivorum TaxID=762845 RepID=A0A1E5L1M2_9ENTE|nr:2-succinyl-5-enolpyruvyl-6-hydroxy-3-cyclohexene-1-carboxylic-acid synthase [Enterococcus rivorum]MBP2097748.1 2-succinyl-5-enolpyruvyl-6-hydroxy-3-cyclohexene-1-carboxylate synthase [Enterococcus rivorum]OEH84015.1 2-succinyl-5-enolpyruvyl-6-hydroxy-3-cyclohexene-1-carboxylic-acid synthase [Enterococcus rivorum]
MSDKQSAMTDYLQSFIAGLINSGVQKAVISPGSRSTPLALLLHRNEKIQTYIEVDERSAGFFALGLSKVSQQPVVLLCTSGTAAANYYPAICEAKASYVPLVVLTTDRPHELRQVGAPQAMDQLQLFQQQVKLFVEMALPENTPQLLDYAYWQGIKTGNTAQQTPKGPVHLNFPLREPLLPKQSEVSLPSRLTEIISGENQLTDQQVKEIVTSWHGKRGVLIVGGEHQPEEATSFVQLAEKLQWPIIGDPLDNLTAETDSLLVMNHIDLFIDKVLEKATPEIVVRFGKLPLSKNLMLWLQQLDPKETRTYFIDETGEWLDQLKQGQIIIQAEEKQLVKQLINFAPKHLPAKWSEDWINWQQAVEMTLSEITELASLNEISASRVLHQKMAKNGQLFISNSNAIRFIDRYADKVNAGYRVYGNRGINGIDGIVSTALGMCAVQPEVQNVLLIGDLALYHDMNGLLLAKRYHFPLTIVLLNNNGGGIFSFLSQRQLDEEEFELLFGTPIDLDFSQVAELYGAAYAKVESLEQLASRLEITQKQPQFQIIEVVGNRQENVILQEKVQASITKKLRG